MAAFAESLLRVVLALCCREAGQHGELKGKRKRVKDVTFSARLHALLR